MKHIGWIIACVVLCTTWLRCQGETVLGIETDEFDFDGLPGAVHEFTINIPAGYQECFYQKIVKGGKIHISFEVMKGGDMTSAMFLAKHIPGGELTVLQKTDFTTRGGFQYGPMEETWPYAICVSNGNSMLASKLVYVYLVTYVEQEWTDYRQELEDVQLTVTNFTTMITSVQNAITDSLVYQAESRMHVIKDWFLTINNNTYVLRWSICQCVVIVISSVTQVFALRRLFRTTNVKSSRRPRV